MLVIFDLYIEKDFFSVFFFLINGLQETILHQRQMALLRFQQQEQEMQMKRMQLTQGVPPAAYQNVQMPFGGTPPAVSIPADPAYTRDPATYDELFCLPRFIILEERCL